MIDCVFKIHAIIGNWTPHIIFNARRAQKQKKGNDMVRKSLSLCVCVCVCVCACTHAYARIRVSLRVFLLAQNLLSFVSRVVKLGNVLDSVLCFWSTDSGLWRRRKDQETKAEKCLRSFVRSCCSPSLTCVPSLFSFSLSKNPIQSNPIIQKTGGSEQKSFTGEAEKVQLEHPQARHGGHQLLDER